MSSRRYENRFSPGKDLALVQIFGNFILFFVSLLLKPVVCMSQQTYFQLQYLYNLPSIYIYSYPNQAYFLQFKPYNKQYLNTILLGNSSNTIKLQKMKLRIEKNAGTTAFSCSRSNIKSSSKTKRHDLLSYRTWRTDRNNSKMVRSLGKSKSIENSNQLRTLLGDISHMRNLVQKKSRLSEKQQQGEKYQRQLIIKSIDFHQSSSDQCCQISVKEGHNVKKYYHKATTAKRLWAFIKQKHRKVECWKSMPSNIALDYYLSFGEKDTSFLNGQSICLQPYELEKQEVVNIKSFDILHCIGTGGFSKVFLCRFKQNGKLYAMKVIDKRFIIKNKKKRIVMNEKKIMEKLKHPFLIQMKFAFQSKNSLIFVLQLCPGGELFGLVKKFRIMNQNIARFYIVQILLGLQQIHKNQIVYRDFKPQNILIDMEGHIRIADFGLAKPGIPNIKQKAYSFCGSPQYMPPQMIMKKGHSLPVDFYCLGALLYELVTGLPPFYSENPNQIYEGTLSKPLSFPSHAKISDQLKDLLKNLLCKDETHRLGTYKGVQEVFNHPWLKKVQLSSYMNKSVEPPVKFTGIKDLKLIFSEMQIKNQEYTCQILSQQQNEDKKSYQIILQKFYFDYREKITRKSVSKTKRERENSFSGLSLQSNRSSLAIKSKQKLFKNILSQRILTGSSTMRKKPLSTRYLDVNLYLR